MCIGKYVSLPFVYVDCVHRQKCQHWFTFTLLRTWIVMWIMYNCIECDNKESLNLQYASNINRNGNCWLLCACRTVRIYTIRFPLYRVVQDAVGCINTLLEPCSEEELDDLGVLDDLEEANRLVDSTCSEEGDWGNSLNKRAAHPR